MLEILGFSFKNFKGLIDEKIIFVDRNWSVIPVVGLNESGKSTLLEAIYTGFAVFKENNQNFFKEYLEHCYPLKNASKEVILEINIELTNLSNSNQDFKHNYETLLEIMPDLNSESIYLNFKISYKDLLKFNQAFGFEIHNKSLNEFHSFNDANVIRNTWYYDFKTMLHNILPTTYYYSSQGKILSDFFALSRSKKSLADRNEFLLFNQLFLKIFKDYEEVENIIASDKTTDKGKRKDIEDKLNTWLIPASKRVSQLLFDIFGQNEEISNEKPFEIIISLEKDNHYGAISTFYLKRGNHSYRLDNLSDGIRWIVSIVLVIEILVKDSENVLLILDEPGNHLHPNAQEILIEYIIKSIGDNRLIYSTHSHHMIPRAYVDDVLIVQNSLYKNFDIGNVNISIQNFSKYATAVEQEEKNSKEGSSGSAYTDPILKLLKHSLSELELQPTVVIMEGKIDFFVFDYFLEILKKKYPDKYTLKSKMLRPARSATKTPTLAMQCFNQRHEFLVILDSDDEGITTQNKIKKNKHLQTQVYTIGEILQKNGNKIRVTEDLFEDKDIEMLKLLHPYYNENKDIIRAGMRKLLKLERYSGRDTNVIHPFSSQTMDRFEKIFDFIEEQFTTGIKKRECELQEIELKKKIEI
ncbi:MAG: AAA family ATPase [Candidatus Kapabacteria bacterium]|nr:AAA family ATPase [Candidatus Kapabacteria bacterium]